MMKIKRQYNFESTKNGRNPHEMISDTVGTLKNVNSIDYKSDKGPHGSVVLGDGAVRHVIGPLSRIDGGIYVQRGLIGAVEVDMATDHRLRICYEASRSILETMESDGADTMKSLVDITKLVNRILPYDEERISDLLREEANAGMVGLKSKKVGDFSALGVTEDGRRDAAGICYHQALLMGAILERGIDEGIVEGEVSFMNNWDYEKGFPHAFDVYTKGEVTWIVDPAMKTVHSLQGKSQDLSPWRYGLRT